MANEPIIAGLCAAAEIVSDHWTQGALARDYDGDSSPVNCGTSFCLEGALNLVFDLGETLTYVRNRNYEKYFKAFNAVQTVLRERLGDEYESPFMWNDDPERTADEVVAVLLQTADYVREHDELKVEDD